MPQCSQLCGIKVTTRFRVFLETRSVKRICVYVGQNGHRCLAPPCGPPGGHLSEAELCWTWAPNHRPSTLVLISRLSSGFSTLIRTHFLKTRTRSSHFHLQSPLRTPAAYNPSLNAYPWMLWATSFPASSPTIVPGNPRSTLLSLTTRQSLSITLPSRFAGSIPQSTYPSRAAQALRPLTPCSPLSRQNRSFLFQWCFHRRLLVPA